jgi:cell division septum initiation protein DivIVA
MNIRLERSKMPEILDEFLESNRAAIEGLIQRNEALCERVARLERALEKTVKVGYASSDVLPRLMAAVAEEALEDQ